MTGKASRNDLYATITNRIIADLEQGVRPWFKPWSGGNAVGRIIRPLRHTGEPYSGINVLLLWQEASERGFTAPHWMTFKQAHDYGAHVRKGEKGTLVVYANSIQKTETTETGEEKERSIPFLKSYVVFNAQQIEGLPARYLATTEPVAAPLVPLVRIGRAEAFFAATGSDLRHGGNQAYYAPVQD